MGEIGKTKKIILFKINKYDRKFSNKKSAILAKITYDHFFRKKINDIYDLNNQIIVRLFISIKIYIYAYFKGVHTYT